MRPKMWSPSTLIVTGESSLLYELTAVLISFLENPSKTQLRTGPDKQFQHPLGYSSWWRTNIQCKPEDFILFSFSFVLVLGYSSKFIMKPYLLLIKDYSNTVNTGSKLSLNCMLIDGSCEALLIRWEVSTIWGGMRRAVCVCVCVQTCAHVHTLIIT